MARRILDFHPAVHGFQFANSWHWTPQQREKLIQTIESFLPAGITLLLTLGTVLAPFLPIIGPLVVLGLPIVAIWLAAGGARAIATDLTDQIVDRTDGAGKPVREGLGLCGGMTHAAIDYWIAGKMIPGIDYAPADKFAAAPPPQSEQVLRDYIFDRLLDTFLEGKIDILAWHDAVNDPAKRKKMPWMPFGREMADQIAKVKAEIDRGRPATLCIFKDVDSLGEQHQVLAYGYDDARPGGTSAKPIVRIYVYDPNYPGAPHHMDVTIDTTTNMSRIHASFGGSYFSKYWLGFFLFIAHTPKTPPDAELAAAAVGVNPAPGWHDVRVGLESEYELHFVYSGTGQSLPVIPDLEFFDAPNGASLPNLGTKTITAPEVGAYKHTARHTLTGEPGRHVYRLVARRDLTPNADGEPPYKWRRVIDITTLNSPIFGVDVEEGVTVRSERLIASGPTLSAPGVLGYNFHLQSHLSAAFRHDWSLESAANAAASLGQNGGADIRGTAMVPARAPEPSWVSISAESEEKGGIAERRRYLIDLPRASAQLLVRPDRSTPFGTPRRAMQNILHSSMPIVWERDFLAGFVTVRWFHLVGAPSRIRWSTSLSSRVHEMTGPLPGTSADIRISLQPDGTLGAGGGRIHTGPSIGTGTTGGSVALVAPRDATVRIEIEDDAGQRVVQTIILPTTHRVGAYVRPGQVGAIDGEIADVNVVRQGAVSIFDSARERLAENAALADRGMFALSEPLGADSGAPMIENLTMAPYGEALHMSGDPDLAGAETFDEIAADEMVLFLPEAEAPTTAVPASMETGEMEPLDVPEQGEIDGVAIIGHLGHVRAGI